MQERRNRNHKLAPYPTQYPPLVQHFQGGNYFTHGESALGISDQSSLEKHTQGIQINAEVCLYQSKLML